MLRKCVGLLLLLACGLALAGCGRDKNREVDGVLNDFNTFTNELVGKINSASDPSTGVDEAQKFLDSRRADIQKKLDSIKDVRQGQVNEQTRQRMVESLSDNYMAVASLQTRHIRTSMTDTEFKRKLDKLVSDYQELFKI